jgi:hypothetical protein
MQVKGFVVERLDHGMSVEDLGDKIALRRAERADTSMGYWCPKITASSFPSHLVPRHRQGAEAPAPGRLVAVGCGLGAASTHSPTPRSAFSSGRPIAGFQLVRTYSCACSATAPPPRAAASRLAQLTDSEDLDERSALARRPCARCGCGRRRVGWRKARSCWATWHPPRPPRRPLRRRRQGRAHKGHPGDEHPRSSGACPRHQALSDGTASRRGPSEAAAGDRSAWRRSSAPGGNGRIRGASPTKPNCTAPTARNPSASSSASGACPGGVVRPGTTSGAATRARRGPGGPCVP